VSAVNGIGNSELAQKRLDAGPRSVPGVDLAGSVPVFGSRPGSRLTDGVSFADFSRKRLIFGDFTRRGETHVYRVNCKAGDRLRAQLFVPVLPRGGAVLPTFAIIGAGIPVAAGAALTAQVRGTDDAAIGVFGDGAANIGAFHEGLNLAAIWNLPVVFICENNQYGEYSRIDLTTPIEDLADRAASYGIPGIIVDGQDPDQTVEAVSAALDVARSGGGPTLLEMKTYRYAGHSRADKAEYRPEGEFERWYERDPINTFRARLESEGLLAAGDADAIDERVAARLKAAIEVVEASPPATVDAMFGNIYAPV